MPLMALVVIFAQIHQNDAQNSHMFFYLTILHAGNGYRRSCFTYCILRR